MNFIVDAIIIAIIAIVIVRSSKKGFVSSLVDTFAMIIATIVSYMFTPEVSQFVYDSFIKNSVSKGFEKVLDDMNTNAAVADKVDAMIASLPEGAVNLADRLGIINLNAIGAGIHMPGVIDNNQLITTVLNDFAYNVMITITKVVVFFILFVLATLVLRMVSNFLENINKIPLIGKLNSTLGGVLGVAKALIIILVVCTVMYFIISSSDNVDLVGAISDSKIYNFVTENNPLLDITF
ncbi:MAG: CvpA family protein [Clostridia bacterium]|nr:CvpA family protein [Clostridia bacterium]MBP3560552.1 CvpA family protein [Clostridia bacterium]